MLISFFQHSLRQEMVYHALCLVWNCMYLISLYLTFQGLKTYQRKLTSLFLSLSPIYQNHALRLCHPFNQNTLFWQSDLRLLIIRLGGNISENSRIKRKKILISGEKKKMSRLYIYIFSLLDFWSFLKRRKRQKIYLHTAL